MWLFGVIGRTKNRNQPIFRYTLDNQYISTVVAEVTNDTSYNELFAYFYNLNPSHHTLVVENVNEGASLFLDYYLVEPMPPDELAGSMGNLLAGGKPMSTSISEHPMLTRTTGLSVNAAIGSLIGAVIGGLMLAFLIAIVVFILWRRRGGSKPYYYQPAAAQEVLFDGVYQRPDLTAIFDNHFYRAETWNKRVYKGIDNLCSHPLPHFTLYRLRLAAKYSAIPADPDENRHVSK